MKLHFTAALLHAEGHLLLRTYLGLCPSLPRSSSVLIVAFGNETHKSISCFFSYQKEVHIQPTQPWKKTLQIKRKKHNSGIELSLLGSSKLQKKPGIKQKQNLTIKSVLFKNLPKPSHLDFCLTQMWTESATIPLLLPCAWHHSATCFLVSFSSKCAHPAKAEEQVCFPKGMQTNHARSFTWLAGTESGDSSEVTYTARSHLTVGQWSCHCHLP